MKINTPGNFLPFITALCPTFRRPDLLANSLWLWEKQTYPANRRRLIILDDGGTFDPQEGKSKWYSDTLSWRLYSNDVRYASLPEKYNALVSLSPLETDAFLIWEDDDFYLPEYVASYADAFLHGARYVKPDLVLSDYPGYLVTEKATGRFHATLGFTKDLLQSIGGWPETKQAQFDQMLIQRLQNTSPAVDPWTNIKPQYIFGWHTGMPHGQNTMKGPEDETWYDRAEAMFPAVACSSRLEAVPLPKTLAIFNQLGIN